MQHAATDPFAWCVEGSHATVEEVFVGMRVVGILIAEGVAGQEGVIESACAG